MKRRMIAVTAWALAILAVPSAGAAQAPARVPDIAATAAALDRLTVVVRGNVEQLTATQLLNYRRLEGGIAKCMRAAGHPYRKAAYVSTFQDFTDADLGFGAGSGSVFDTMTNGGRRAVLNEIAAARLQRAGVFDHGVPPRDNAAYQKCRARFDYRQYPDFDLPAGLSYRNFLPGLLDGIASHPAVEAAMLPYESCMKRKYGYVADAEDRTDFLYAPRFSYTDAPLDGETPKRAWTQGIAKMEAAFAADADCRRPAYEIAMKMLAPRIGPWEKKHRAYLAAIQKVWREQVAAAGCGAYGCAPR